MSGIIGTSHSKSKVIGRSKDTAKAWVNFSGNTNTGGYCTINDDYNVTSVADNGTGDYSINLGITMKNVNYTAVGMTTGGGYLRNFEFNESGNPLTTTVVTVNAKYQDPSGSSSSMWDPPYICVLIFGD